MKKVDFLFVMIFTISQSSLYSQSVIPFDSLDGNNVKMLVYTDGYLAHDKINGSGAYLVPKDSGTSSIYSMDLWITGIDAVNSDTFLFENTYRRSMLFSSTFNGVGPIANSYSATYEGKYKRLWKLSKDQIEYHKQNVGKSNYVMIDAVENWPAHGDVGNGEAFYLAPFIDWNQDGIYTPEFGDYPCIKGDQAIYTISNNMNADTGYKWTPFPLEIHQLVYSFNTSDPLNNAVFMEYKIVNRSVSEIEEVYVGNWIDFDIGCYNDDFMGCDSNLNFFYAYNGDAFDEDCGGAMGYKSEIPFCGEVFLNQKLSSFIMPGRGTNPIRGDATVPKDFVNYLGGRWLDGEKIKVGGNGHPSDSGASLVSTTYMFPADPRDTVFWNESTVGNVPFDRRGVGASGPFIIESGQSLELALAIVFTSDASKQGWDDFDTFKSDVNFVQNYYDNNIDYCPYWTTDVAEITFKNEISIYPNPARDIISIDFGKTNSAQVVMYDAFGKEVLSYRINGNKVHTLDVSSLQRGFYLLSINDGQQVVSKKVLLH